MLLRVVDIDRAREIGGRLLRFGYRDAVDSQIWSLAIRGEAALVLTGEIRDVIVRGAEASFCRDTIHYKKSISQIINILKELTET